MAQLDLDFRSNPEALLIEDADGTQWVTGYDVPAKHGDSQGRVFFVAVIPEGEPSGSRTDRTALRSELNAYTAKAWAKDIMGALGSKPMSWNQVVLQLVDAHPAAVQGTTLEQGLWMLIEAGKVEHDADFRLRKVKTSKKRKPIIQAKAKSKAKAKKPSKKSKKPAKGKAPRRPARSYDRPGVREARTAACVVAAKRWGSNVRETCGAGAPSPSQAARTMAERKWTSPAGVASEWKAHAPWARAGNPKDVKRWLNPNGLRHIEDPLLDLERYPYMQDALVGAFLTDQGMEIYIWGETAGSDEPTAPFYVAVHLPKTSELLWVESGVEDLSEHATVMEALGSGLRVAMEAEQASWHPGYYSDFDEAMAAFVERPRNRVEFVRLFFWNDPNGAYYSVLTMEMDEVTALFNQTFADLGVRAARVESYDQIKSRLMRE